MNKYQLVNPMTKNGIRYWQIQSLCNFKWVKVKELGGYVTDSDCLSQHDDSWIYPNSFVKDSLLMGEVSIHRNSIITDSNLFGALVVSHNTSIENCDISIPNTKCSVIRPQTEIKDKKFSFTGFIDNRITKTNYWCIDDFNNINIICSQNYAKTGCYTLSYIDAWQILNGKRPEIIQHFLEVRPDHALKYTKPENIEWMKQICRRELNRLNIKIEEGN